MVTMSSLSSSLRRDPYIGTYHDLTDSASLECQTENLHRVKSLSEHLKFLAETLQYGEKVKESLYTDLRLL